MSRRTEKFWEDVKRLLSLPFKIATDARGIFATLLLCLTPLGDPGFATWAIAAAAALVIALLKLPASEIRKFRASLFALRKRVLVHLNEIRLVHAVTGAALCLSVFACLSLLILHTERDSIPEQAAAPAQFPAGDANASASREVLTPEPSQTATFPHLGMQSASVQAAVSSTWQNTTLEAIPLPPRRFTHPCELDEPDDATGRYPVKDYEACLAYLKKHPPKTGIGGPGAPPLPRARPRNFEPLR